MTAAVGHAARVDDVDERIGRAQVGQELVAPATPQVRPRHQPRHVNECARQQPSAVGRAAVGGGRPIGSEVRRLRRSRCSVPSGTHVGLDGGERRRAHFGGERALTPPAHGAGGGSQCIGVCLLLLLRRLLVLLLLLNLVLLLRLHPLVVGACHALYVGRVRVRRVESGPREGVEKRRLAGGRLADQADPIGPCAPQRLGTFQGHATLP